MNFSYNDLKHAHARAEQNGLESFVFLGHELLTKFAWYLLQYVEGIIESKGIPPTEKCFNFKSETEDIYF